jgi:peptidoglycan/xylan/chitin deacetylase (PgdA/CDA1 family)
VNTMIRVLTSVMRNSFFLSVVITVFILASTAFAGEKQGGIVLAFDDGYPSWISVIAPELKRVGGVATGFVNNQRIRFGDLSFDDLLTLQNKYGWEIGTHTYHHFNAPTFVKQKCLSVWVKDELEASVAELRSHGLKIQSMVFPYNAFTKELGTEVMKRFKSFRRDEVDPLNAGINEDGSVPGTEIDTAFYVPLAQMFKWIDFARQEDKLLFLYGHKVLPDEDFFTGTVASVSMLTLVSKEKIKPFAEKDLCLVPDTRRRLYRPIKIDSIKTDTASTFQNLSGMSEAGATFMIGPCYGMQLSYFRKVIKYGAERLPFYTVDQAVDKLRQASKKQ